jgi:hypothetical protein
MLSLWRRFVAWFDEPDEVTVFVTAPHSQHCPTCAASRVPEVLRTDEERLAIAREWTAHYKGPARG